MVKEVNLLNYWMPVLRQLKEFKEIAKAEEPELRYLLEACDSTLNNFFISTADEQGISRFESMIGIFPDEGADLDTRRLAVLAKWGTKEVYTDKWLYDKLLSICGSEDKFSISPHYEEYAIDITVKLGVRGVVEIISSLLSDVLPCNLVPTINHSMETRATSTPVAGVVVSTAMSYQITHDIKGTVGSIGNSTVGTPVNTATVITLKS